MSQFRSTLSYRIKEGLQYDAVARSLLQAVKEEKYRFWEKDGLLYTKGRGIPFSIQGGIRYVGTFLRLG